MKKIAAIILFTSFYVSAFSQDIVGKWQGEMNTLGEVTQVGFNIDKIDGVYKATMGSPSREVAGIEMDEISFENNKDLKIQYEKGHIKYIAALDGETFNGIFTQSGNEFLLNLKKVGVK